MEKGQCVGCVLGVAADAKADTHRSAAAICSNWGPVNAEQPQAVRATGPKRSDDSTLLL